MSITNMLGGTGNNNFNRDNVQSEAYSKWLSERLRIDVEPEVFESATKTKMSTTKDLGIEVNKMLRPFLSDYEGCTFKLGNMGQLVMSLYFVDRGASTEEGKIKSVITQKDFDAAKGTPGNAVSKFSNLNDRSKANVFTLNAETREILYDLIPYTIVSEGDRNKFWNDNVLPVVSPNNGLGFNINSGQPQRIEVPGLDVGKLLKLKYGSKENRDKLEYAVSIIRPISGFGQMVTQGTNSLAGDFLISIMQLNTEQVRNILEKIGFNPNGASDVVMFKA